MEGSITWAVPSSLGFPGPECAPGRPCNLRPTEADRKLQVPSQQCHHGLIVFVVAKEMYTRTVVADVTISCALADKAAREDMQRGA